MAGNGNLNKSNFTTRKNSYSKEIFTQCNNEIKKEIDDTDYNDKEKKEIKNKIPKTARNNKQINSKLIKNKFIMKITKNSINNKIPIEHKINPNNCSQENNRVTYRTLEERLKIKKEKFQTINRKMMSNYILLNQKNKESKSNQTMDNKIRSIYKNQNVENNYFRKVIGLNYTETTINESINKLIIFKPIKFIPSIKKRKIRLQYNSLNKEYNPSETNIKIRPKQYNYLFNLE